MVLHSALWRRVDAPDGLAHGAVSEHEDGGFLLDGAEIGRDGNGSRSVRFSVVADLSWRTQTTFVEVLADDGLERVTLEVDAQGEWTLDGRPWPDLAGCTDVDIAASPLTNTLPVRRLGLAVGETATVEAAWIDVPSLAVHRVPQTYQRLADSSTGLTCFSYVDPAYGPFLLTVDAAGLVVDYQDLFARVG